MQTDPASVKMPAPSPDGLVVRGAVAAAFDSPPCPFGWMMVEDAMPNIGSVVLVFMPRAYIKIDVQPCYALGVCGASIHGRSEQEQSEHAARHACVWEVRHENGKARRGAEAVIFWKEQA